MPIENDKISAKVLIEKLKEMAGVNHTGFDTGYNTALSDIEGVIVTLIKEGENENT